jgi:hypothetical protein
LTNISATGNARKLLSCNVFLNWGAGGVFKLRVVEWTAEFNLKANHCGFCFRFVLFGPPFLRFELYRKLERRLRPGRFETLRSGGLGIFEIFSTDDQVSSIKMLVDPLSIVA